MVQLGKLSTEEALPNFHWNLSIQLVRHFWIFLVSSFRRQSKKGTLSLAVRNRPV